MANVASLVSSALSENDGILRLTPTWVPRSFLQPGRRLKLHPNDYYAFGMDRGGIDERWFASTTPAANENRRHDEGLSYIIHQGQKVTLADAVSELKSELIGEELWNKYERWPVYSKFFDNMGPIPHHMHQNDEQAALVGQQGKPESYYFPPQMNAIGNNFPYTFMGFEPGVTKEEVIACLDRWNEGDNGILDLSKAYRLKPGTGWLIPPCVLHAPGSLVTYEPQWGSDVFGMYQSLVEGRMVPRSLLTKDFPEEFHNNNEYLVNALDWEKNVDPNYRDSNYLEPVVSEQGDGWVDNWIVYGKVDGKQLFTAKEMTLQPGAKCTIKDGGAYGLVTVQGRGKIGKLDLQTPVMIRFGEITEDEVFVTAKKAREGVTFENTGTEPLVSLRYFGPDAQPKAPANGAWKLN
ncbi:class I mannose-6-phosphate isomerase [Planctomicrobium sp. SH527]|uniref:class I mannose-6-phosphate isomerase n=1 Tax=Planctomicrobium sp. SH527 TaxID=3448123 RepID=UPI003F5BCD87